jgi:hypothetical protein
MKNRFLKESEQGFADQPTAKSAGDTMTAEISLDQRIDALFTQYEKESLPGGQDSLAVGTSPTTQQPPATMPERKSFSLKSILVEMDLANENGVGAIGGFIAPIQVKKKSKFKQIKKEIAAQNEETLGQELPLAVRKNTSSPTLKSILSRSLFEADEPPPPPDDMGGDDMPPPPDDMGGDGGGDAPGGDGAPDESQPHTPDVEADEPPKPKVNVNTFARGVARLVSGYRDLLDPERVILNRAKAYITRNYDEQAGEQLMRVLDVQYNIRPLKSERQVPAAPGGYGSGPDSSSGGGGGGS